MKKEQPTQFYAKDRQAWRGWLELNHGQSSGVWLVYDKGSAGVRGLAYSDIVEEALCFGWVDSLPRSLDDKQAMFYVSPRKPKSPWSKINKERVDHLIKIGLMTKAGLEVIERAKEDGSWNVYDTIEAFNIPEDLQRALAANQEAKVHFESFSNSAKKQLLWWVESAKRPETRQKRIEQVVTSAEKNENPLEYVAKNKGNVKA